MNIITVKDTLTSIAQKPDTIANYIPDKNIPHPSYRLYVSSANCQFEIFLDGAFLYSHKGDITKKDGSGFSGEIPINNYLLRSGTHNVVVKILPRFGENKLQFMSGLDLRCYKRNVDNYDEEYPDVFKIDATELVPGKAHNGLNELPYFEMRKSFDVKLPFAIEGWSKSVNLQQENEEPLKKELELAYNKIHKAIFARNMDSLKSWMKEFQDIRNTSFYFTAAEGQEEWAEFIAMISNKEYEIKPLPQHAFLHFYADGKLVTLSDEDGEGIIKLVNKKDEKDVIHLEFKFHRKTAGSALTII